MDEFTREVAQSYDAAICSYVKRTSLHSEKMKLLSEFIRILPPQGHVLDVACGPGLESGFLVEKGMAVTGIDVAPQVIAHAKAHVGNARFEVMDCRALSCSDNVFDGVLSLAGIVCLKKTDAPRAVREMYRVLKRGGVLLISTKLGDEERWVFDERDGVRKYYAHYQKEELSKLLTKAGFKVEDISTNTSDTQRSWITAFAKKEF